MGSSNKLKQTIAPYTKIMGAFSNASGKQDQGRQPRFSPDKPPLVSSFNKVSANPRLSAYQSKKDVEEMSPTRKAMLMSANTRVNKDL